MLFLPFRTRRPAARSASKVGGLFYEGLYLHVVSINLYMFCAQSKIKNMNPSVQLMEASVELKSIMIIVFYLRLPLGGPRGTVNSSITDPTVSPSPRYEVASDMIRYGNSEQPNERY